MTITDNDQPLDFVIVGQGIAGTTLAWQLRWQGLRGLIIDADNGCSASNVAAGLMTPVTGRRLVPAWRLDECWSTAVEFYRRVEAETDSHFLTQPGQVRLFDSQQSQEYFVRRNWNEHPVEIQQPQPLVNEDQFKSTYGGFELPMAGRLDVPEYLRASRNAFETADSFRIMAIESGEDVTLTESGGYLARLGIHARRVIFCQGTAATRCRWFSHVKMEPARGEILTLRIDGLTETRIVNQGVWLTPCGDGIFKAGSTYDLNNLDAGPTVAGREEICERLRRFLRLPFEMIDHTSGVRPIVSGRQPVIGLHPEYSQLGIFNGLGSKGSLLAPYVANQLAERIVNNSPIDSELDVCMRFSGKSAIENPTSVPRLTEQAHAIIRSVVHSGEIVVDATAGNGHDTCFLAELVGSDGSVFAFDVQDTAVQRTTERLANESFTNTAVLQRDHADMQQAIPARLHGQIAAVMFNLGYLPGGDHSITTRTQSSVAAIRTSLTLIRRGGVITILAYPGHSGGNDETVSVQKIFEELPCAEFETVIRRSPTLTETAPLLFAIIRR